MSAVKKITARLDAYSDYFLMVCLGVMGIVLFMQVVFRYVLNAPLVWGEELARYLHVWIALMGIRFGLKYNAHLKISFFYERFPKKIQEVVNIIVDMVMIVCIIIYMPGAYRFFINQTTVTSPAMEINMGLVHVPVILGFIGAFIHLLNNAVKNTTALFGQGGTAGTSGKISEKKQHRGGEQS